MTELTIQGQTGFGDAAQLQPTKSGSTGDSSEPSASFRSTFLGSVQWTALDSPRSASLRTDGTAAEAPSDTTQALASKGTPLLLNASTTVTTLSAQPQVTVPPVPSQTANDNSVLSAAQLLIQATSGKSDIVPTGGDTQALTGTVLPRSQKLQSQLIVAQGAGRKGDPLQGQTAIAALQASTPAQSQAVTNGAKGDAEAASSAQDPASQTALATVAPTTALIGQISLAKAALHDVSSLTAATTASTADSVKPVSAKSESRNVAPASKAGVTTPQTVSPSTQWSSTVATISAPVLLPATAPTVNNSSGGRAEQTAVVAKPVDGSGTTKQTKTSPVLEPASIVAAKDSNGAPSEDVKATADAPSGAIVQVAPIHAPSSDSASPSQFSTALGLLPSPAVPAGSGGIPSTPTNAAQALTHPGDKAGESQAPWESQPQTLAVTPNVLEVGVSSGSHGFLRVRAEVNDAGAVSASVTSTSAATAESLHKQMPEMSAYLAEEHIGLSSLVMEHTRSLNVAGNTATDLSAGSQDTGAMPSQQNAGSQGGQPAESNPLTSNPGGVVANRSDADQPVSVVTNIPAASLTNGMWLNVLA